MLNRAAVAMMVAVQIVCAALYPIVGDPEVEARTINAPGSMFQVGSGKRIPGSCVEVHYGRGHVRCADGQSVVYRQSQRRLQRAGSITISLGGGTDQLVFSGPLIDGGPSFVVDRLRLEGAGISLDEACSGICEPSYGSRSVVRNGLRCFVLRRTGEAFYVSTAYDPRPME